MNYRSKASLLGLPLVNVRTAEMVDGRAQRGIARGWIAIGDIAFGVVLSVGGIAFGGISLGGLGLGLISLAGLSVGIYAIGGSRRRLLSHGGTGTWLAGCFGEAPPSPRNTQWAEWRLPSMPTIPKLRSS